MRFSGNGCQPCRDARKKCDRDGTTCRRCARSGKHCYGRREAFGTVHIENDFARGLRKRPRGARVHAKTTLEIKSGLSRDIESEALAFYMQHHVGPADVPAPMNQAIHRAVADTPWKYEALELAMTALSMAIFYRAKKMPQIASRATRMYQKSVRATQTMLSRICMANLDVCLLTVWFLSRFEDSIHNQSTHGQALYLDSSQPPMPRSRVHARGAAACLEHWVHHLSGDHPPSHMVKQTRRNLMKAAVMGNFEFPGWLEDGALYGEGTGGKNELALDRILIRLSQARQRVEHLAGQHTATSLLPSLEALYLEVAAIDCELLEWQHSHSSYVRRTKHTVEDPQQGDFFLAQVCIYDDVFQAAHCMQLCASRILAQHSLIRIAQLAGDGNGSTPDTRALESSLIIDNLAHEIACTVPFCLQRVQVCNNGALLARTLEAVQAEDTQPYIADLIAFPLSVVYGVSSVGAKYRHWFQSQLAAIGRLTGYGIMEYVTTQPAKAMPAIR